MSLSASTTNGNTHRAAVITPGRVFYGNGTISELQPGMHTDLGTILGAVADRFTRHATIVIDGVPLGDVTSYPAGALRRAGWNHRDIGIWSVFHRSDGRTCAVGVHDAMQPRFNHFGPLYGPDTEPGVMAMRLDRYAQATGYAWRGTFATTSLQAIRLTWENSGDEPRWTVPRIVRVAGAGVLDWRRQLTDREHEWGWVHTFDAHRAYLTAAAGAELAWSELAHTGARPFDARVPGYWRLRLGEATRAGLADPLRPPILTKVDDGTAWMTTPIAALVVELDPTCRVLDSHLGRPHKNHPAGVALLKPWAFELAHAFTNVAQLGGDELLTAAVKRTYKDAIGGMQRAGMRIVRPDWAHTVIDWWRAWMYRRILAVRETQGVWPVRIKTDSVSYADGVPYPQSRGASRPYTTLTDELRVHGCELGCGCSKPPTALSAGFRHEASTTVAGWLS